MNQVLNALIDSDFVRDLAVLMEKPTLPGVIFITLAPGIELRDAKYWWEVTNISDTSIELQDGEDNRKLIVSRAFVVSLDVSWSI